MFTYILIFKLIKFIYELKNSQYGDWGLGIGD